MESKTLFKPSSVCIRRAHSSVTEGEVASAFWCLFGNNSIGETPIEKIDMVERLDAKTQEPFWLIFIHFHANMEAEGTDTEKSAAKEFSDYIDEGKEMRIQYRYPFYFKVVKNNSKPKMATQARVLSEEDVEELKKVQQARASAN